MRQVTSVPAGILLSQNSINVSKQMVVHVCFQLRSFSRKSMNYHQESENHGLENVVCSSLIDSDYG